MSQVLYRKYRPHNFTAVVGQEHVVKTLQGALKLNKVAHAYLFSGPRGSGKTTMARLLAKALNCGWQRGGTPPQGRNDACGKCHMCTAMEENRLFDLVEIDAASHRGIDDIRQLKESVRAVPLESSNKIFIIDEVHMLSKDAFNALLKLLEEPPKNVYFILATTEPHKVLPTVLSRVQRFDFRRLTIDQILRKLSSIAGKENISISSEALSTIASTADGSLRDAESNLTKLVSFAGKKITSDDVRKILGLVSLDFLKSFTEYIIDRKEEEGLKFIATMYESGVDFDNFSTSFLEYLRNIAIMNSSPSLAKIVAKNFSAENVTLIAEQAKKFTVNDLVQIIRLFINAKTELKDSPIPQLPIELAFLDAVKILNKNV